jgi:hypothetical protein
MTIVGFGYLMAAELSSIVNSHEQPVPDQIGVHTRHTLLKRFIQLK